jgi:hypothetical protein
MDGRMCAKMAKDSHLLDKKLTSTDVDIIFAKVKDKSQRKINIFQFKQLLTFFANKKNCN